MDNCVSLIPVIRALHIHCDRKARYMPGGSKNRKVSWEKGLVVHNVEKKGETCRWQGSPITKLEITVHPH